MELAVHNGKLYGGTVPLAEVYGYDGSTKWTKTGRLDFTPELKCRRAKCMAVFQGKFFVAHCLPGVFARWRRARR